VNRWRQPSWYRSSRIVTLRMPSPCLAVMKVSIAYSMFGWSISGMAGTMPASPESN
jgi:hypothetical protein